MGKISKNAKEFRLQVKSEILKHAPTLLEYLEYGYTEGQFYEKFPIGVLSNAGIMTKTSFVRFSRKILKEHKIMTAKADT